MSARKARRVAVIGQRLDARETDEQLGRIFFGRWIPERRSEKVPGKPLQHYIETRGRHENPVPQLDAVICPVKHQSAVAQPNSPGCARDVPLRKS